MNFKVIQVEGIGEVTIEKSSRSKQLRLSLRPFKGIKVTIPMRSSFADGERFVYQKIDWLKQNLSKIQKTENQVSVYDTNTVFKTRFHQLEIKPETIENIKIRVGDGKISIFYPRTIDVKDERVQKAVKNGIEAALRIEARHILPHQVKQLAEKHGFTYNKVGITSAKTRWGSCSSNNSINLTLHLMRLPNHLIDYVILHELCHTKVKNHGTDFWALLDQVSGNAKRLSKEMKNYSLKFY